MNSITPEFLIRCANQYNRKRGETEGEYLCRITHLYCADKNITAIQNISQCGSLIVLYLYDNLINRIENLEFAKFLTHLYLQGNNIAKIENLSALKSLRKLYLGRNCITVVEGLDQLQQLTELHIEYQKLPLGEKLLFDPKSIVALITTLSVLNVAGNRLDYLGNIKLLNRLGSLNASDNQISSILDVCKVISTWGKLTQLQLQGNPVTKKHRYRESLVTSCTSLNTLDGNEISEITRLFLINWKAAKEARMKLTLLRQSKSCNSNIITDVKLPTITAHISLKHTDKQYSSMSKLDEESQEGKFPNIFVPYSPQAAKRISNWTKEQWNKNDTSSSSL
ncbi:Protein phosphatase 1 regulatory subunit 42 [Oopsacas minuta]|uniref:Protein phosphatase 1 regulatory subunit 42 n=1 Tax=Oopsacas minuta TaxID=111878 RepID=A0AAV7KHC1_9METZ|nr:Protein phosphatase 1 regulatory subunit 42 [Oopsacas minuta]